MPSFDVECLRNGTR